jgi:hypothetical protein
MKYIALMIDNFKPLPDKNGGLEAEAALTNEPDDFPTRFCRLIRRFSAMRIIDGVYCNDGSSLRTRQYSITVPTAGYEFWLRSIPMEYVSMMADTFRALARPMGSKAVGHH